MIWEKLSNTETMQRRFNIWIKRLPGKEAKERKWASII